LSISIKNFPEKLRVGRELRSFEKAQARESPKNVPEGDMCEIRAYSPEVPDDADIEEIKKLR